jgi:hypothetical protein
MGQQCSTVTNFPPSKSLSRCPISSNGRMRDSRAHCHRLKLTGEEMAQGCANACLRQVRSTGGFSRHNIYGMRTKLSWLIRSAGMTLLLTVVNIQVSGQVSENAVHPKEALEFDYCGNLVPATVPHLYAYAFRLRNSVEEKGEQRGKTFRGSFRYELGISEADFVVFENSAIRFGGKEKPFNQQLAAIKEADRAQHPELHGALSDNARKATHAILAERDKVLAQEVDDLHSHLAPKEAEAVDKHMADFYVRGLTVPKSAPRASVPCVPPA